MEENIMDYQKGEKQLLQQKPLLITLATHLSSAYNQLHEQFSRYYPYASPLLGRQRVRDSSTL
jgi:23S rRNA A2030 N6-methylase RlmJ